MALAKKLRVKPLQPDSPSFADIANAEQLKWAVTEGGELRVIPHSVDGIEISHAVLTGGKPVLAAGEAQIAVGGGFKIVTEITPQSGHFLNGSSESTNLSVLSIGREAFGRYGIFFP